MNIINKPSIAARLSLATIASVALFCATSHAQQAPSSAVRTQRNISLGLANDIAAAALAACSANGHNVAVTVVDRAGGVRAVQRADNAGPHTLGASQQKTFTAASAKNTTLAMQENVQKNPAAPTLVYIPAFCWLAAAFNQGG